MKAIILAAGKGKRLKALTQSCPKCMIPIGGTPLLIRTLKILKTAGVRNVVLVVGFQKEKIMDPLGDTFGGLQIQYVENKDYERGSMLSLWAAKNFFEDDLLIMDADVLYPARFIRFMLESPSPNLVLLDQFSESRGEEQMLLVKQGQVIESTKKMKERASDSYDLSGEGVGFLKLSREGAARLEKILETLIHQKKFDLEYEDTFKVLFEKIPVHYYPVGGLPWVEIDFPEDIRRAEEMILPKINDLEKETT